MNARLIAYLLFITRLPVEILRQHSTRREVIPIKRDYAPRKLPGFVCVPLARSDICENIKRLNVVLIHLNCVPGLSCSLAFSIHFQKNSRERCASRSVVGLDCENLL